MTPTPTPPGLGEREAVARTIRKAMRGTCTSEGAADIVVAGLITPLRTENETLRAERDAARETNRELHRRLQAAEGPMAARMERGERDAAFWLEARKEAGRRASHALFRANRAETEALRLTAKLAQAEGEIATMRAALERLSAAEIAMKQAESGVLKAYAIEPRGWRRTYEMDGASRVSEAAKKVREAAVQSLIALTNPEPPKS